MRPVLGIFLMLGFTIFGPTIDVFAKLAGEDIPLFQISASRFIVQIVIILPFALWLGGRLMPSGSESLLYLARGALILTATSLFFAALRDLPLADALAIFFVEPFILLLLAALLLKEKLGWRRLSACGVGFSGALLVIQPQYDTIGLASLFPIGTAVCFAFYLLLTRKMAQHISPINLQLNTSIAAALIIVPLIIIFDGSGNTALDPVWPSPYHIMLLFGVGLTATIAHMFLTYAFRFCTVTILGPLQYLELVSATIFGLLVFSDLPNTTSFIGMGIIVMSGLYVLMREHALEKRSAQHRDTP
jgi:drug/metabolite transporter (DMT)-like permease